MTPAIGIEKKTVTREIFLHIIFWLLYFCYLIWDAYYEASFPEVLLDSVIYLSCTATLVYLNLFVLARFLLNKRKYLLYTLSLITVLAAGAGIKFYVYTKIIPGPDVEGYSDLYIYFSWFFLTLFEVAAISSINIVRDWMKAKDNLRHAENQRLEVELKFLKAQMNPHFLFNTLNNIYFLISKDAAKASDAVLRLSELLRFRLYDTNGRKISIQEEINHIRNYIEIERLRTTDKLDIEFTVDGNGDFLIEPFIFLDFVENAFKHNGAHAGLKGSIRIYFRVAADHIFFSAENTMNDELTKKEDAKGIGLDNIRKRLPLLYPGKHELVLKENKGNFIVNLTLRS